ncbi:hypothetical protein C0991_000309 [Blastosporella zonata]|nr:hypothetical protein C0991_000309 [Blastosporella zonata]
MLGGTRLRNGYNEGADKLWSIYVSEAERFDSSVTETWKADMDSTLIFAGLFSAVVTAFIIESYQLLEKDSTSVTNDLLTQLLVAQIVTANGSSPVVLPSSTPAFVPSTSAVIVNILWFLSLSCSLAAALCVTLVQKWVRNYLQRIQRHSQLLKRARVRSFIFNGSKDWKVNLIIEYIPTLLHMSLFLFFSGLYIFLFNISIPVSSAVAVVVIFLIGFYGLATLAPLLDPATPYDTPLTALFWYLLQQFGARFSHRCSSQQRGTFQVTIASKNLAAAREQLALNPADFLTESLPRDAQAFVWAHDMITNDRELESFIASIPGFLKSEDGCQTWEIASPQLPEPLEDRITELLTSCSKVGYADSKTRRFRATVCIEALASILGNHIRHDPSFPPQTETISRLSRYVTTMTRYSDESPVTSAICTLALFSRQYLVSKLPGNAIPNSIVELSQAADKALKDVDDMRRTLEDVLQELSSKPEYCHKDIGDLLQMYFGVLAAKSQDLLEWEKTIGPILYEHEESRQHVLLSWYSLIPDIRHFVKYRDIPNLDTEHGGLELYALQVLSFMRDVGTYPQICPKLTQNPPASCVSPAWFPKISSRIYGEIQPISLLLNLLEPNPTSKQVESFSEELKSRLHFHQSVPYPEKCLILTEHLGSFSTIAFVLEDIRHGARVLPLLELVIGFKFFAPKVVEAAVIREMLETIFPPQSPKLTEPSQILFVAVLRVVIDWEKEAFSDSPCPFSPSDITFLVHFLKENISYESSLETAERLLGTSFNQSLNSFSYLNTESHNTRIGHVYDHILTQRQKRDTRTFQRPRILALPTHH